MRITIIQDGVEAAGELKGLIYNYARKNNIPAEIHIYDREEDFRAESEQRAEAYIDALVGRNQRMHQERAPENTSLIIKKRNLVQRVPYRSILYFSKEKHYAYAHTHKEEYKFIMGFPELKEAIPEIYKHCFIQCYRSFIVNLSYVQSIHKDHILLLNGEEVPVGGTYAEAVRRAFEEYFT